MCSVLYWYLVNCSSWHELELLPSILLYLLDHHTVILTMYGICILWESILKWLENAPSIGWKWYLWHVFNTCIIPILIYYTWCVYGLYIYFQNTLQTICNIQYTRYENTTGQGRNYTPQHPKMTLNKITALINPTIYPSSQP